MSARDDTDPRQRSAFRVLVPPLVVVLVLVAAFFTRLYTGERGPGALVLSGGFGLVAIWALYDGLGRMMGQPRFLGTGQGLDRLVGAVQVLLTVGIAIALLPNTIALLNYLARMATGGPR